MKGLWKCAKKGDEREFTRLLALGDSLQDKDNVNRTPLHYAAEFGSIDIAKLIVSRCPSSFVDLRDIKGDSALEIAIQNGHEELAVLLVLQGANVDALFNNNRKTTVPKRLELKLREADQKRLAARHPIVRGSPNSTTAPQEYHAAFAETTPPEFGEHIPTNDYVPTSDVQQHPATTRATPTPPSFGKPQTLHGTEVIRERPQFQQARVVDEGTLRASAQPAINAASGTVDVATVLTLLNRVVHAGLYEEFNPILLKEINAATAKLTNYLPVPKDGLRIASQNLREVGQFPVLGPMDPKRTKRVREDYVALYERIRPLQDALRVLELDRRAHAPTLIHPPLLYLIGGAFSMFISVEQPLSSHFDQVVNGISRAIRELPPSPSRIEFGQIVCTFVQFLRCVVVRILEIRTPTTCYDIVLLILAMSKALKSFTLEPSNTANLKIVVENLKNVMVTMKSTLPSKLGKELLPAEEGTLYAEAADQFKQTIDAISKQSAGKDITKELDMVKSIASQMPKLQTGFAEIHSISHTKEKMKGSLGALGRGVLGNAQQLATEVGELARHAAGRVSVMLEEEWKEAKLVALETMLLCAMTIELVVGCISVRNRLPHHSHVPLLALLFSIASQFAMFPYI